MIAKSTKDFQNKVLKKMTFSAYPKENYILYTNKKQKYLGYFIKYSRNGYYDFGIGDYTIPTDFSLYFEHSKKQENKRNVHGGKNK